MDYRDWEQKIKRKLESASPEETGYSVNAQKVWDKIAAGNKRPKRLPFLARPVWSHAAAAISGILLSTLIYFLVFRNPQPEHSVAGIDHTQQHLPKAQKSLRPAPHPKAKDTEVWAEIRKPKPDYSKDIAVTPTHPLIRKKTPTAVKSEHREDTVPEYALVRHDSAAQQITVAVEKPAVMYWSDIKGDYKNKSEPQYWAKLVRRIDKRREKDNSSQNDKAPVLVWIETFK